AGENGSRHLEGEKIWSGYWSHWSGKSVCARRLPQIDYETGKPVILLWPDAPVADASLVELYFNERLVKYPLSFLGHLAVLVNGKVFNFSHWMNENEAMSPEEYFFRPALGEFAPDPASGRDNTEDSQRPYYDKFGRLFMRTIHVLRISGLDTRRLSGFFFTELEKIRSTPPDPKEPGKYRDFHILTKSCATIIRDGFQSLGFEKISGIFPRDLFVNMAYFFLKPLRLPNVQASLHTLRQLQVPEAAPSAMPPLLNPQNRLRYRTLRKEYDVG
nr:hypothetical protein [Smithellaceae bacterium]